LTEIHITVDSAERSKKVKGRVAAVIVPVSESTADLLYKLADYYQTQPAKIIHSAMIDFLAAEAHRVETPAPLFEWQTR